jgi:predicted Rossmann-fold nucleotide-binding protein
VLNVAGYYDHLIAFNAHMADVGFVRDVHRGILLVADGLEELLDKMTGYVPHKTIFQMKAEDL